jgi:CRISPR-associated protein Cmr5
MPGQTFQQQRARFALEQVQEYAKTCSHKEFKSRAGELPFMIHANGLGQALAFFKSKGNDHGYNHLYSILSDWLCGDGQPFEGAQNALEGITNGSREVYMAAQAEAILLMDWVKKFSRAYMSGDEA